ncbi:hypothetical protein [Roseovarius nitratireducens]|uniref:hypothetical protein n=1 Tax=Roseovarius nitratireducens TaxID=2044597 RepID=UPI000CE20C8F|nr:hypothetical protein [Roseovarius nitratireducens]
MSDPVANVDIEDVLSSIRRLVSNGPEKGGKASKQAREEERLVLTPSQRIDDSEPSETGDRSDRATSALAGLTDAHPPEPGLSLEPEPEPESEERGVEDDVADVLSGADAATDTDTVAEDDIAALSLTLSDQGGDAQADAMPGAGETDGGKPEDGIGTDTHTEDENDDEDAALEGIAAMFARHESTTPSAWEPDGDDEDAFADHAAAPSLEWRDVDDTDEDDGYDKILAGPDHPEETEPREEGRAFARDRDAEVREAEDNAFAIDDEALLDEEALRDLVAEIVREELMGTLGERITRNVRKLVRREIHRALNSQDFD